MKKKIYILLLVILLVGISLVACSGEGAEETNTQESTEVQGETEKPEDLEEEEEVEEEVVIDSSLEGLDLMKSISGDRPKTMKMVMDMTSLGATTISTTYYDNDNTRTDTVVEGLGTSVLIHDADEEVIYQYIEGSGEGVKILGADMALAEEAGLTMDMSNIFSKMSEEVSEEISGTITARVEELDGEEVVYIESKSAEEEVGDMLVKMWYSTKYNTPLKYEVFMNEKLLMLLSVVEIEKNIKIDKGIFQAPSDINFEEINVDEMLDMM